MSVVIHPNYQGNSLTNLLMNYFINAMKEMGKKDIYLICQTDLIALYAKYGFIHLGESSSDHGGLCWHEMSLLL
jgi:predicted GNAT family N-acyltransferase